MYNKIGGERGRLVLRVGVGENWHTLVIDRTERFGSAEPPNHVVR